VKQKNKGYVKGEAKNSGLTSTWWVMYDILWEHMFERAHVELFRQTVYQNSSIVGAIHGVEAKKKRQLHW
jgi:hypothetical protein